MHFEESFPAVPVAVGAIRGEMVAIARECGLDGPGVEAVALAVSEAATNAIVHGYRGEPGTIRVSAAADAGELTITVADDGNGLAPRTDSPGLGLGLPIIGTVARRLEISSENGGTRVQMVFPCPDDGDAR